MGFLDLLFPRDKKYFPLFTQASANLVKTSKVLVEMVNAPQEKRREMIKEIEHLEHTGDNITHMIYSELGKNFITPFDREDIHALASAIDDVLDFIHGSAKRIDLYKIHDLPEAVVLLAEIIYKGAIELNVAVNQLHNMRDLSAMKEACVKINSLENHADDVFNMAIARLFEEEKDAVQVIKVKELFQAL